MSTLQKKVEELARANENLTYENEWIRAKLSSVEEVPLLHLGNEEEFFPNEIKDMVLDALEEKLKNSDENSRRADVLRDILDKNGKCKHIADKKAQKLKQELKGYKNVSKSMRRMLSEMGFIIEEEGKHYKLIYYGDPRYWTTLAKTPSDIQTGENEALTIIRKMF